MDETPEQLAREYRQRLPVTIGSVQHDLSYEYGNKVAIYTDDVAGAIEAAYLAGWHERNGW
jgi:hypothetical protein